MPQITVTLSDEAYWELRQIEKGLKSAFVNEAVMCAVAACHYEPEAYRAYCRGGPSRAREKLAQIDARGNPNQMKLEIVEEVVETENEKWIREQKEANE